MKKKLLFAVLTLILVLSVVLVACDNTPATQTYKITFYFQDSAETSQSIDFDENFAIPQIPSNGKKAFAGWYTDAACTDGNEWTTPQTLEGDISVYAKWKDVYVTFDLQNGDTPEKVLFDDNFTPPTNPSNGDKLFQGWYTDAACTDGNEWTIPETLSDDITVYAKWHTHDFGDNYIMFVTCLNGCDTLGRNASTNVAKETFVYNFDEAKQAKIDGIFADLIACIIKGTDVEEFEELWYAYDDSIGYVGEQYQYAYVFYCTNTSKYEKDFDFVSDYYNECVTNYYSLFRIIYESAFCDYFFEGWTEEEIEQALIWSDSYGDERYLEVQNKIDDLILEYDALVGKKGSSNKISNLYGQLVALNNQLAQLAGYENYMQYAYENKYERYYTPEEVVQMRQYVKEYIAPLAERLYNAYLNSGRGLSGSNNKFYNAITNASVFRTTSESKTATNFLGEYFKQMIKTDSEKAIDFYKEANLIFKNGNYYTGRQSGAFSYYIPNQNTTILYFSNDVSQSRYVYQGVFTFAHEFGHYYNNVYNQGLSLSMDHDETQSQGNEMLFLAWLFNNKPGDVTFGYDAVMYYQLFNMAYTIILATAVDEFEYAAYTGIYEGKPVASSSGSVNYNTLFKKVLGSYTEFFLSDKIDQSDYWSYVVFDQAGYYISYAMSALPSLEIYVNARYDYDSAKESYLKLFTFSDDERFVETDESGNRSVIANYGEILEYCGLKTPFQVEMYETISLFLRANS